ncbi:MAG: YdeI/OmpD-associated family protein, partial [Solirubrobacterales bacterium]|nr:YdeI/OmpD-associated family protein [Solirubrobacterales bacterium]
RAERLIAAGRMRPAGQAEVDAAKADGRWEAAYSQAKDAAPDDLAAAIAANPAAAAHFATLSSQNRFAMIFRLQGVQREATRAKRIREYVQMLAAGRSLH